MPPLDRYTPANGPADHAVHSVDSLPVVSYRRLTLARNVLEQDEQVYESVGAWPKRSEERTGVIIHRGWLA